MQSFHSPLNQGSSGPEFVLKFNRWTHESATCLRFWVRLASLSGRPCTILQDLWLNDEVPETLTKGLSQMGPMFTFRSTEYSDGREYRFLHDYPNRTVWYKPSAANFTAFELVTSDYFWLIDADDTIFLADPQVVYEKLLLAEEYTKTQSLDGFSYAFYRHFPPHCWSLGVALLKRSLPLNEIKKVEASEIVPLGLGDNVDGACELLRLKGRLDLKSFILNKVVFHHHTPKATYSRPGSAFGVYYWEGGTLDGKFKVPSDVMQL